MNRIPVVLTIDDIEYLLDQLVGTQTTGVCSRRVRQRRVSQQAKPGAAIMTSTRATGRAFGKATGGASRGRRSGRQRCWCGRGHTCARACRAGEPEWLMYHVLCAAGSTRESPAESQAGVGTNGSAQVVLPSYQCRTPHFRERHYNPSSNPASFGPWQFASSTNVYAALMMT